jgi:hypothetical protein
MSSAVSRNRDSELLSSFQTVSPRPPADGSAPQTALHAIDSTPEYGQTHSGPGLSHQPDSKRLRHNEIERTQSG